MNVNTCKRATAIVALLSAPASALTLPPPVNSVDARAPAPPNMPAHPNQKIYTVPGNDIREATIVALRQLGYTDLQPSTEARHVTSVRVIKTIVYDLQGEKVTISRIKEADAYINTNGCSTTLRVTFSNLKVSWDGGSLLTGAKAAPINELFAIVDRQVAMTQDAPGQKSWLSSCAKPQTVLPL